MQNPRYEYATEFLPDDSSGCPDQRLLNRTLSRYAEEGWRLHSIAVNEIGHNSQSSGYGGVSNGTNATIDVTVLIFERCIRPAEY